jgi:hypothetical protein
MRVDVCKVILGNNVAFVRRKSCVTHRKCVVGILLTVFRDVTPAHNIAKESGVFIFENAGRRSAPFRDICKFIPDCTASHPRRL